MTVAGSLRVNEVAYCVDLHLDTCKNTGRRGNIENEWWFESLGKFRPAFILQKLKKTSRGCDWFLVLRIYSEENKAGRESKEMYRLESFIKQSRVSWILLDPLRVPENMIGKKIRECDQQEVQNLVKIVSARRLGFKM